MIQRIRISSGAQSRVKKRPTSSRTRVLDQIARQVLILEPDAVQNYLRGHRNLGRVLPTVCGAVRKHFGADAELALEVYRDPEIDDEYLALIVRRADSGPDFMGEIEAVGQLLHRKLRRTSGHLLITTDFRAPRGLNAV